MTFDSFEEAQKIIQIYPEAKLILRIAVEETDAPCPMGKKFGAPEELWSSILDGCKRIKAEVIGVSFHVGSGGCNPEVYKTAMEGTR